MAAQRSRHHRPTSDRHPLPLRHRALLPRPQGGRRRPHDGPARPGPPQPLCRLARKWSGNVLPNPVCDTELPSWGPEERPKAVRSPEPAEVLALLEAARVAEVRVAVLIRLVPATGMRRGEACAVRWNDLDTKAGIVVIDEGVVSTPTGAEARQPKTRSSTRTGTRQGHPDGDCRAPSRTGGVERPEASLILRTTRPDIATAMLGGAPFLKMRSGVFSGDRG